MHCEDCGTKLDAGICPNCQEELYIFEQQGLDDCPASADFMRKVAEQRRILREHR
jgi:hypothetical protein